MKPLFIFLSIVCVGSVFAQEREMSLVYRYGTAFENFSMPSETFQNSYINEKVQRAYDHGLQFSYSRQFWKRFKLSSILGCDISQSNDYQRILTESGRNLENIELTKYRLGIHFGLQKRISLGVTGVTLDLGLRFVGRLFLNEEKQYKSDFKWGDKGVVGYKYTLDTYHGDYYNNDVRNNASGIAGLNMSSFLSFPVTKRSAIQFGLSITTHNVFFYDYSYTVNEYVKGSSYQHSNMGEDQKCNIKYSIRSTNIYFNLGYTFRLKNRGKKGK